MNDIDLSKADLLVIRDSLRASSRSYGHLIDSGIFDADALAKIAYKIHSIDSVLKKINEWFDIRE